MTPDRTTIRDIDVIRGDRNAPCINCGKSTTRRLHPGQSDRGYPTCWDCQHFCSYEVLVRIREINKTDKMDYSESTEGHPGHPGEYGDN